jgi:hypothetical protein
MGRQPPRRRPRPRGGRRAPQSSERCAAADTAPDCGSVGAAAVGLAAPRPDVRSDRNFVGRRPSAGALTGIDREASAASRSRPTLTAITPRSPPRYTTMRFCRPTQRSPGRARRSGRAQPCGRGGTGPVWNRLPHAECGDRYARSRPRPGSQAAQPPSTVGLGVDRVSLCLR